MSMNPILELRGVSRRFGGLAALTDVSLSIGRGEVIGLLGPNGAGKTTLVNVITGVHRASSGCVMLDGSDITGLKPYQTARLGLGRTFQVVQPFPEMTALENVAAAALFAGAAKGIGAAREQAMEHLEFTGLAKVAEQNAATLTLAMRKRLELAKGLAMRPRVLLLDEVNAGLNNAEIDQALLLIRAIAAQGVTILLIEHLMKVVLNVSTRLIVLHHGELIASGSPQQVVTDPAVMRAYLGRRYSNAGAAAESGGPHAASDSNTTEVRHG